MAIDVASSIPPGAFKIVWIRSVTITDHDIVVVAPQLSCFCGERTGPCIVDPDWHIVKAMYALLITKDRRRHGRDHVLIPE